MTRSDEIPTSSWYGNLRSYMARKGLSQVEFNAFIGGSVQGRSAKIISATLRVFLRNKAKEKIR